MGSRPPDPAYSLHEGGTCSGYRQPRRTRSGGTGGSPNDFHLWVSQGIEQVEVTTEPSVIEVEHTHVGDMVELRSDAGLNPSAGAIPTSPDSDFHVRQSPQSNLPPLAPL